MEPPVKTASVLTIDDLRSRPTITVAEAAAVLGIHRDSAYQGVRSGDIPSIRIGSRYVIPTARLLALLGITDGDE